MLFFLLLYILRFFSLWHHLASGVWVPFGLRGLRVLFFVQVERLFDMIRRRCDMTAFRLTVLLLHDLPFSIHLHSPCSFFSPRMMHVKSQENGGGDSGAGGWELSSPRRTDAVVEAEGLQGSEASWRSRGQGSRVWGPPGVLAEEDAPK